MPAATDLPRILMLPPEVPLHLNRIEIELRYTPAALALGLPEDRARELARTAQRIAELVQTGFLCRPFAPDPSARLGVRLAAPDRLVIGFAGAGAHVNLLVLMIRLLYRYHQTPAGLYEAAVAAAENPAEVDSWFTRMVFAEHVAGIALRQIEAVPGAPMRRTPDGMRALSQDMGLPGTGPLAPEPVIEAELLSVKGPVALQEDVGDAWLQVAQFGLFLPPDFPAAHEPGDEGLASGPKGKGLEIEEISVEQVFLFELLAVLSAGRIAQLAVTAS